MLFFFLLDGICIFNLEVFFLHAGKSPAFKRLA
jgi:hypothetical protein